MAGLYSRFVIGQLCTVLALVFCVGWPLLAQPVQLPTPQLLTTREGLPQSFVPAIVQDRQGFIWMATRDGLCRFDGYTFRSFRPASDTTPTLSSPGLTNIVVAPDGALWITNDQQGLDRFDPVTETFQNVSRQLFFRQAFGNDTLDHVYADRKNQLWLAFRRKGVVRLNPSTYQFRRFTHQPGNPLSLASNQVYNVQEDGQGRIWLATQEGLDRFDEARNQFSHFTHVPGQAETLPERTIKQIYPRKNGELWLFSAHYLTRWNPLTGRVQETSARFDNQFADWHNQIATDSQGADYIKINDQLFVYRAGDGLQPFTKPGAARLFISLMVDGSDALWVGTDLAGVYNYNLRTAPFRTYPYQQSFQNDLLRNQLGIPASQLPDWSPAIPPYSVRSTIDLTRRLWVTVGGDAMFRVDGQTVERVPFPVPLYDYKLQRPVLLATDPAGPVWVIHPAWSGFYQPSTRQWTRFSIPFQDSIRSPMLQAVVDRQFLWLATAREGLYRVNRATGQVRRFTQSAHDSTSLSSNSLYWLSADPIDPNLLWVGTFGNGLCRFQKQTGRCERLTTRQGLPNDVIYAAIPDRWGSVWIATNQGLGQLNRKTGHVQVYTQEDGLNANEFNRFHALSLPDGRIVLGTIRGTVGFDPKQIQPDTFQPRIQLADVLINNRVLKPGEFTAGKPITGLTQLVLPYDQNFITVRFAAMQYNHLGRMQYRYRLAGLRTDWINTTRPEAIYTALQPGQYDLHIQATSNNGQWSRHVYTLGITVQYPWWQRWWAWLGYALFVIGLGWTFVRYRLRRATEKQARFQQQQEAAQLRQVDELKTRFFANITHDFRTPLSLILSPVGTLLNELSHTRYADRLQLIDRSARQLLGLINQLMDLARLDANLMSLNSMRGRPDVVVGEVVSTFMEMAEREHIRLTYRSDLTDTYWFDSEKLERIVINLLANALKFTATQDGSGLEGSGLDRPGQIVVGLQSRDNSLPSGIRLTVADNGPGIAPDHLPHLFDRFYQADDQSGKAGTGIGLALVKELVDLHGGTIWVDSQVAQGTTFWVDLPMQPAVDFQAGIEEPEPVFEAPGDTGDLLQTVRLLLVEDNDDMAQFIIGSLPDNYDIHRAVDGLDGLEQARQLLPELIISDVMMPRMDGFALCDQLKSNPLTNHIPVLLLTAKTTLTNRMEGLQAGADDYLSKPFHVPELLARINNLLAMQRRLSDRLRTELASAKADSAPPHPFLQQLYAALDQQLDKPDFGVDELADAVHLSRMQLHRKLKTLTSLSTTEFIRSYRLKQAMTLLTNGLSVTQTAYAVGFANPTYFSQRFREQFGNPPSSYLPTPHK